MRNTIDIYSLACSYLRRHPEQIMDAWDDPLHHPAGILFQYATPTGMPEKDVLDRDCGEIRDIACGNAVAYSAGVTDAIRAEAERVPVGDIEPKHLAVFAEMQSLCDLEWNRNPLKTLRGWGFDISDLETA